jgi:GNAT superfamily N-acetyltransferase
VAQKLMEHAEQWAREQGLKQLVLNVFAANAKVLKIYQKLGYETEQIKMVKILSDEA